MCNSNFARHDFLLNHNKTKNLLIGNEKQYYQIQIVHWDYLLKNYRSEFIPIMYPSLKQTIYMTIETCWLICICNIDFSIKTICQDIKKKIEHVRFNIYHPTIFILNGKLGYLYVIHIKLLLTYEMRSVLFETNFISSVTFILNCIRDMSQIKILSRLSCNFEQCFLLHDQT